MGCETSHMVCISMNWQVRPVIKKKKLRAKQAELQCSATQMREEQGASETPTNHSSGAFLDTFPQNLLEKCIKLSQVLANS